MPTTARTPSTLSTGIAAAAPPPASRAAGLIGPLSTLEIARLDRAAFDLSGAGHPLAPRDVSDDLFEPRRNVAGGRQHEVTIDLHMHRACNAVIAFEELSKP